MSTPLSTPIRQAKLGISSTKSLPLTNEYKRLLNEQYQRLWLKHQQDLDLIDDIRSYVKSRLSIEREYTQALSKLSKQHITHINKRFTLLQQCDNINNSSLPGCISIGAPVNGGQPVDQAGSSNQQAANQKTAAAGSGSSAAAAAAAAGSGDQRAQMMLNEAEASDSRLQKRLANNGLDEPDKACTLYKVWSEHINRLQLNSKNRGEQFEQLTMIVDKLKDIRSHKANIGKKCLDSHLKRIHEDILVSLLDVEKARKLYYEDESQAKKARENEEKCKKKRSGLLTKFTGGDLQAKKEKTSAQREANDIQSTQARNDYIMALAAANAHLQHYYVKDLSDFMSLIDDGVLDDCKIFMATLSECDINSLKDALHHAQYWSKMINLTGSQKTNSIFLDCEQSQSIKNHTSLAYEPCNSDPISSISLEHNADYALQHEIDKWFTWFKKECRNLSQLIHQLERCQRALAEGQKSIELNGQTIEDLEPKIIELKQQIRKSEAAKLKAQARLKVIKEGGMQIEEWGVVESEIRADMLRAQEEIESKRLREVTTRRSSSDDEMDVDMKGVGGGGGGGGGVDDSVANSQSQSQSNQNHQNTGGHQVLLQISKDSDGSEMDESMHNLASVSRSTSNLMDKQQKAISGYSALTDPSLVWQDDYSNAWNAPPPGTAAVPIDIKPPMNNDNSKEVEAEVEVQQGQGSANNTRYNHLETSSGHPNTNNHNNNNNRGGNGVNNTVQSSSPLSAIMDGNHGLSTSPYQQMGEAYKSDYECDYNRTSGPQMNSAASSEQYDSGQQYNIHATTTEQAAKISEGQDDDNQSVSNQLESSNQQEEGGDVPKMLGQLVIAQYTFDKTNEDDLSFNEGDILRVIEISDSNWLRARNEATQEQGFIPAPYVKLLEPSSNQQQQQQQQQRQQQVIECESKSYEDENENENANFRQYESYVEDSIGRFEEGDEFKEANAMDDGFQQEQADVYCRALYDYQPEADTYDEQDGLPHLALIQGELLRVLDQGQEDGWWLVEKVVDDGTAIKGHVPSMLVEELEEGEQGAGNGGDDDDDDEDDDGSDSSDPYPDLGAPPPPTSLPMPNIDPPKLDNQDDQQQQQQPITAIINEVDQPDEPSSQQQQPPTSQSIETAQRGEKVDEKEEEEEKEKEDTMNRIPTSFIVIQQPTPEVESRSIMDPPPQSSSAIESVADNPLQEQESSKKSYSVVEGEGEIEDDFVLSGPDRKPSQLQQQQETPAAVATTTTATNNYEPLSECDDLDIPAPPAVVIESFEVEKHDSSSSADEDENNQPTPTREIKHTGNVDVNPMLRLQAEEFTKQIIAEAMEMTQRVTPTDSRRINNEDSRYNNYNGIEGDDLEDDDEEEEEENQ